MANQPSPTCQHCKANAAAATAYEASDHDPALRPMVTSWWHCDCGAHIEKLRGEAGDVDCDRCSAEYNAFGQRLRSDWRSNPSNYDSDVDDLEGFELSQLAAESRYE